GCNEPGSYPERYLDRGTSGSLLMAFPGTGNKGVPSTEAIASTRSASQRRPTLVWLWFCSLRHVNAHLSFNITITQMPTQTYFPLFTKLPEGRVERWRLVEEFIDTWYRPLRASDGVSEAT